MQSAVRKDDFYRSTTYNRAVLFTASLRRAILILGHKVKEGRVDDVPLYLEVKEMKSTRYGKRADFKGQQLYCREGDGMNVIYATWGGWGGAKKRMSKEPLGGYSKESISNAARKISEWILREKIARERKTAGKQAYKRSTRLAAVVNKAAKVLESGVVGARAHENGDESNCVFVSIGLYLPRDSAIKLLKEAKKYM